MIMNNKKKKSAPAPAARPGGSAGTWIVSIGLAGVLVGTLLPIIFGGFESQWFKYIYTAGAILSLAGRFMTIYKGANTTVRRLSRIEMWSSVFFCVAAFFMFYSTASRDWIAFTLAGGVLMLYTSIRIPRELAKDNQASKDS